MMAPGWLLAALASLALMAVAPSAPAQQADALPAGPAYRGGRLLSEEPYLRIKRGSEARVWGDPLLVGLVRAGTRAAAAAVPGSIALVGDLSARDGGPLPGHVSHRTGCDADVAFFASDVRGRSLALDLFEAFGPDGRSLTNPDRMLDLYRNWVMLRAWLSELRVVITHVFISAEIRQLLLEFGSQRLEFSRYVPLAVQLLRPHSTHADHFHVRIICSAREAINAEP